MEDIRLIKDKAELEGTAYFEILPGPYKDKCWNEGSIFIEEEIFGLIEPIIERHVPEFDHYSFIKIDRESWMLILNDLSELVVLLQAANTPNDLNGGIGFIFNSTKDRFVTDFARNKEALAALIIELVSWLKEQLNDHYIVTVLGL
jgi:hypothetical protein